MDNLIRQQSGMVIVLAVLIITAVLSSAILFGDFIIREIQQSRIVDDSIQSYYAAENGLERSLYQLRRREAVADCLVVEPIGVCNEATGFCTNSGLPCISANQGDLVVNSPWQVTVSNETTLGVPLSKGESFQVDLFDPANLSGLSGASSINRIEINVSPQPLDVLLELTNLTRVLAINDIDLTNCLLQQPVAKTRLTGAVPQFIETVDGQTLYDECSYVLKLNWPQDASGSSAVFNLTFYDKFDNSSVALPIPSRLIIDSEATFGKSFQAIRVRTPIRPPLSGIYDFVLFSEESIVK